MFGRDHARSVNKLTSTTYLVSDQQYPYSNISLNCKLPFCENLLLGHICLRVVEGVLNSMGALLPYSHNSGTLAVMCVQCVVFISAVFSVQCAVSSVQCSVFSV